MKRRDPPRGEAAAPRRIGEDPLSRPPFLEGGRPSPAPPAVVVYTGSCHAENLYVVEEEYQEFLEANGGPTLGWPEELHSAFLQLAHRAQRDEAVPTPVEEPLFISAPHPPAPPALLEAARAWLCTVMPVADIERHVELYTQQQALHQLWMERRRLYELAQAQEERNRREQSSARLAALVAARDDAQPRQRQRVPLCEVPWGRGGGTWAAGHVRDADGVGCCDDPALCVAIHAKVQAAQQARRQQMEKKKRIELWHARKAAEEEAKVAQARREAAAARKAQSEALKQFHEDQQRKNQLRLLPSRARHAVAEGDTDSYESPSEDSDVKAAKAALEEERKEVAKAQREVLAARRRRDLHAARARHERINAVKAYEAEHTKAAVSARCYRSVAAALNRSGPTGGSAPATGFPPPFSSSCSPALSVPRGGSGGQHYSDATASHTQHVLPDWGEVRMEQQMGERARWLSSATQELCGAPSTGAVAALLR